VAAWHYYSYMNRKVKKLDILSKYIVRFYWEHINPLFCVVFAQVVSALSVFFILVSITIFCLKTHPNLRVPVIVNVTTASSNSSTGAVWQLDQRTTDQVWY